MSRVVENLSVVRQRIDDAARRSGRAPKEITLVAVTKYAPDDAVLELFEAGCRDFGESRPQALWGRSAKISALLEEKGGAPADLRWHLIGHLQRNKVDRTLPLISLLHSADSLRLLQTINQTAAGQNRRVPVLLEVNVSGEEEKHGFAGEEIEEQLPTIADLEHVFVCGLMCMAAREGDEQIARRNFAELRRLRDRLRAQQPNNIALDELSMGMSGDYPIAVEEGATIVRIGSALFEGTTA